MIAEALGQSYLIPQRQQPQQVAPQAAPQQEASPWQGQMAQPDQLAQVEGLTSNYYNAYGRLKDFTETMWKDYGLDVTKPDFTQQGGGNLHQAFQAMDADLRLAANDLAQHKKNTEMMNKLQAEGKIIYQPGYDPTKMLSTQLQPYQMYTPTDLSEDVKLAIQGVSNQVYNTPTEAQKANLTLEPLREKYRNLIKSDPNNAPYYQRQIDALRMPTSDTKTFAPSAATAQKEADAKAAVDDFKYYANLFKGNWDPNQVQEYKNINGKTYAIVRPASSLELGKYSWTDAKGVSRTINKTVDFIAKGPDGVFVHYQDSDIPVERADIKTPDQVVRDVYDNNDFLKRYIPLLYQYARSINAITPTGTVDYNKLISSEDLATGQLNKANVEVKLKQAEQSDIQLTNSLNDNLKNNTPFTVSLPEGDITFEPDLSTNKLAATFRSVGEMFRGEPYPTTYTISAADYKKLMGVSSISNKSLRENLTPEQVIELLKKSKNKGQAYNDLLNKNIGGGSSMSAPATQSTRPISTANY